MLISVYFPFTDFRDIVTPGFQRLARPGWPDPEPELEHVRGLGGVLARPKSGFESWVGESRLAMGASAVRLHLPYSHPSTGGRLRLIRKACYFDGVCAGRFEILVNLEAGGLSPSSLIEVVQRLLDLQVDVPRHETSCSLQALGPTIARLWSEATVRRGAQPLSADVHASRPVCFVESDVPAEASPGGASWPRESAPQIRIVADRKPRSVQTFLIWNSDPWAEAGEHRTVFRAQARYLRTYSFRLLQNVELLSKLFGLGGAALDDDAFQQVLHMYTGQVNRSRQRLEDLPSGELIAYCYAAFEGVQPGRIDGLINRLAASRVRLNVRRNAIAMLDRVQTATQIFGDMVMGDKFENIDISGQGVALGRGASATVNNSTNAPSRTELPHSLRELAKQVRSKTEHEDAEVEAVIVEAAAKKAADGDDEGAAGLLKKSAKWVLDLAATVSSSVLTTFLGQRLGIS